MRAALLALLLLDLPAAIAWAQGPAAAPAPSQTFPKVRAESLSDREKQSRSTESLSVMRQMLKTVLKMLEEARDSKDVVKLNCVNEKLTQIKGLLRISEQADIALQEAAAKKEAQAADHEFTKVSIARQKVEQLRSEATECIGQLAFVVDEKTQVEVEYPEGLPTSDPTAVTPPDPPTTRPPPASPIQ